MAIVDAERLNRFMSEPHWTPAQYEEAEDLLVMLEGDLEDRLNTKITPVPFTESCTILDSGLVDTRYHVHTVTSIDGTAVPTGDPLPTGWSIQDHWLRWNAATVPSTITLSLTGPGFTTHTVGRVQGSGAVTLSYMAGLGDIPALRRALLSKSADLMNYRHSDTVITQGLDTTEPPTPPSETWTAGEIAKLSKYRIIDTWR